MSIDRYVFHVEHCVMHANHPQIEHDFAGVFASLPEPARHLLTLEAGRRGVPLATVLQDGLLTVAAQISDRRPAASEFPHFLFGLDVETGGFEPGKHALLAIGCWWRAGNGATRSLRVLVQRQEGTIVEPGASFVNGWESDEQWASAGAVPLKEAVWRLLEFVEQLRQAISAYRIVPVAHNALLDQAFIQWALLACDDDNYSVERWREHVSHLWRCSMQSVLNAMDAGIIPRGSASLDHLMNLSGQPARGNSHDAEGDARAALVGYEWLLAKIGEGAVQHLTQAA